MKRCTKCDEEKLEAEFHKRKAVKSGLNAMCKECVRKYCRKYYATNIERGREYGRDYYHSRPEERKEKHKEYIRANRFKMALSCAATYAKRKEHMPCLATEAELQSAFTGLCNICGVPEIECNKKLCMDHDHETGAFRGWLCSRCNKVLGFLADSEELAFNALHYLMSFNETSST